MNENDKDYASPAFSLIYQALQIAHYNSEGDEIIRWLNANGFANLTCCPECRVDDFTHVEGCHCSRMPFNTAANCSKAVPSS